MNGNGVCFQGDAYGDHGLGTDEKKPATVSMKSWRNLIRRTEQEMLAGLQFIDHCMQSALMGNWCVLINLIKGTMHKPSCGKLCPSVPRYCRTQGHISELSYVTSWVE